MRCVASLACAVAAGAMLVLPAAPAHANACAGNRHALGTARVLALDPAKLPRVGTTQYSQTLPLADREVVLTFDDGPMKPYTEAVLKALADECVRATFFLVGRQAEADPALVRAIAQGGHSIGTHSQNHPLTFDQMPLDRVQSEIDDGIAAVATALGDRRPIASFFRIPGLLRSQPVERHLATRGIAVWSTDADADDWYRIATPDDIVHKAMQRLDAKKRGILLLHDVQPATALALPLLLRELKARGWRVVHVVPASERAVAVAAHLTPRGNTRSTPAPAHWPRQAQPRERPATAPQRQTAGEADSGRARTDKAASPNRRDARPGVKVRYLSRREWDELGRRTDRRTPRYAERGWDPYRR